MRRLTLDDIADMGERLRATFGDVQEQLAAEG